MIIRKATVDDIDILVNLRLDFMRDEGVEIHIDDVNEFEESLKDYFLRSIENETFIALLAEGDKKIISTAFMAIAERPPRKPHMSSRYGTIYNVFTRKEYRRKGISTNILNAVFAEAKTLGLGAIDLLATENGKLLYKKLGFRSINMPYMRKDFA